LQSMRYSGDEGTMIRTAPQWQVAWGIATMGDRDEPNLSLIYV
jgi:hypothetical protein